MAAEITIEELRRRFPDLKIESPEQEQKALEFYKKANKAMQEFSHPDPIFDE